MGWPWIVVLERLAFQQLHGDEVASAVLSNLVDGADIRVVQGGGRTRFALKTVKRERIFFRLRRQELERDVAAQVDVLGFIHNTHPSAAELREDTVVRDGLADHSLADPDLAVIPENTPGRESPMLGPRVLASQTARLYLYTMRRAATSSGSPMARSDGLQPCFLWDLRAVFQRLAGQAETGPDRSLS